MPLPCLDVLPDFQFKNICLNGGGTHNQVIYSPDGTWIVAFSDVGGTRYFDGVMWRYLPTSGNNAGRQVAGGIVTNFGTIYQLVGNGGSAGELQSISIGTGTVTTLATGLHVRANSVSVLDAGTGARPRPVGRVVAYDEVRNLVYYGTENGLFRHDVVSGMNTFITLAGESVRAIAQGNHGVLQDPNPLFVATRSMGMIQIDDPATNPQAVVLNMQGKMRFEDVTYVDETAGTFVAVGPDGVCYYNGTASVDITPTQASVATGNGAPLRWTAVAVTDVNGDKLAAVAAVNPIGGDQWIYRTRDLDMLSVGMWENATPIPVTPDKGSSYFSPPNRIYGNSAGSGPNLTGTYSMVFDPSDATGNTLTTSATLTLYQSLNFAGSQPGIEFKQFSDGLSMLTFADIHVDDDGHVTFVGPDHNSFTLADVDLLTGEPTRVGVTGISDGWGVYSVGTGANKVTVFLPADDNNENNPANEVMFHVGSGPATSWTATGWNTDVAGAPRPGGVYGWDNGNMSYTFVVWADGTGFVRNTYDLVSGTWGTWTVQNSGPTASTGNINQTRPIVGSSDGIALFAMHMLDGKIYRSLNGGVDWTALAPSVGTPVQVRTGRLAYLEFSDTLIVADANGLWRINNASTAATATIIPGISGGAQIHLDSQGCLYVHERGANTVQLHRFDAIEMATSVMDGIVISSDEYGQNAGDLANVFEIGVVDGVEYGIIGRQGAGALCFELPAK